MKRPRTASATLAIWADYERLKPFFREGSASPLLAEGPQELLRATAGAVFAFAPVVLTANAPRQGGRSRAKVRSDLSEAKRRSSLMRSVAALHRARLRGNGLVLVDAAACFIRAETLSALTELLRDADLVGIEGHAAVLGMSRKVLTGLRRVAKASRVASVAELGQILIEAVPREGWRMASLPPVAESEHPVGDSVTLHRRVAERKLEKALRLMDAGLDLSSPGSLELRGHLSFGRNVRVEGNVTIIGEVILEDNVTVGMNCVLENCRIGTGTAIKEFSLVAGARIGAAARVGPFARIRPGTRLGAGCQIGNYVEVKNTRMGKGCKINHHSFIGDAVLGDDVIVGSGSMTCNFDGAKTNRTTLKAGAFVGSGVMLVAPLTVERGAFVAAGSTIVSTAPANSLTIARARQITVRRWKKK